MYLKEIGCEGVDWIHLAQDKDKWWAFVNMVKNFQVKVKLSLCFFLTEHHIVKVYWGVDV
jgi:hypothetical protein